ncbi:MAG: MBL fold metallo-hydrolase [Actinomycetota bacterium]|jgi:glyoxylase-like metal-dependent hydrolase (beta-lactamase superfamily II)|nr:MBL fold metallo-hydrolase [Actinomycetota bacterium]
MSDQEATPSAPLTWNVGEVKITSVAESETPTSPKFLFDGVSKTDVLERAKAAPWLAPHFVSEEGYLKQKIHSCVIEIGDNRIAVDTCVGNDKQRGNPFWHEQQGPFLDQLADAGYAPESITHVICTHLHVDHVGWNTRLVDGEWVPTFPNAEYLFVQAEYDHWQATEDLFGDPVFQDSVAPITGAGLATMVGPDHEVCAGVSFQPTPGHTPGHVSVVIESDGKRAIITGDMAHHPMQLADPDLSSMFDTDSDEARATRHEVFPGWADGETLVIGTHFGTPTGGIMVVDGEGYRLDLD